MGLECLSALRVAEADIREALNAIGRYRKDYEAGDEPEVRQVTAVDSAPEGAADERGTEERSSLETDRAPAAERIEAGSGRHHQSPPGGPKHFTSSPVTGPSISETSGQVLTGAAGGTGRPGGPSLRPDDRKEIEVRAIRTAIDYARDHLGAVEVRDVQLSNKGWDLEIVFSDGSWWPVEVKGFGMAASRFILTRNEAEAAKCERDYRLLLVTGVLTDSGQILSVERVSALLDSADLSPISWAVSSWKDQVASVTEWSEAQGESTGN